MKRYSTTFMVGVLALHTTVALAEEMTSHDHSMMAPVSPPASSASSATVSTPSEVTSDNTQDMLKMMQEIVKTMSGITAQLAAKSNLSPDMSAMSSHTMPDMTMSPSPMQQHQQELQDLLKQIQHTTDSATREQLLQEHSAKMQQMMDMLNGAMEMSQRLSGDSMMKMDQDPMQMDMGSSSASGEKKEKDCKMMKDMKMDSKKGDMQGASTKLLEQRLNDMQVLLNQMLQHQVQATK